MFLRFSSNARLAMAYANQQAQRLNHDYIGTEHILLGILRADDSTAATVLSEFGLSLEDAQRALEHIIKPGPDTLTAGNLPHTPIVKQILEQALAESSRLRSNTVGTEHILLALIHKPESPAAQILLNLGLAPEELRSSVLNHIAHSSADSGQTPQPNPTHPQHTQQSSEPDITRSLDQAIRLMWDQTTPGTPATSANLLLAMLDVPDSLVARILKQHGITEEIIENLGKQLNEVSPEP